MQIDSENIPNKIIQTDYSQLFNITQQEKQHIINTYLEVIKDNVNKEKYSKNKKTTIIIEDKPINATAYSVTLTQSEYKTLIVKLLETLSTDSITLNLITTKLRMLNLPEKYTSINELNKYISDTIGKIQEEETTNKDFITFIVYESEGKTIRTDVNIIGNKTITLMINKNEGKITLTQSNLDEQTQQKLSWGEIKFYKQYNSEEEKFDFQILEHGNNNEILKINSIKAKQDSGYNTELKINILSQLEITYEGKYILNSDMEIPDIKNYTHIILNDMDSKKINTLTQQIINRINYIVEEKKKIIFFQ